MRDRLSSSSSSSGAMSCAPTLPLPDSTLDEELAAADALAAACATQPSGILVLPAAGTPGASTSLLGQPRARGGFPHLHRTVAPESRSSVGVGLEEAARLEAAAHRYVAQGDMARLLARAVVQGRPSLALARGCLAKAAYGQTFLPAVDWLDALVEDAEVGRACRHHCLLQRHNPLLAASGARLRPPQPGRGLCVPRWARRARRRVKGRDARQRRRAAHPDGQGQRAGPARERVDRGGCVERQGGTVPTRFLKPDRSMLASPPHPPSAALTALIATRLDPHNYQRRTADPSAGALSIAMRTLGDFANTIFTLERACATIPEAIEHAHGAALLGHGGGAGDGGEADPSPEAKAAAAEEAAAAPPAAAGGSMSVFAAKLAELKLRDKGGGASFAARVGKSAASARAIELEQRISKLDSVAAFVALAREAGAGLRVEISAGTSGSHSIYLAETTLPAGLRCQRHFWAFSSGLFSSGAVTCAGGWTPVAHTVPAYEYTAGFRIVFFIVPSLARDGVAGRGLKPGNCCFPVFLSTEARRTCGAAFEMINHTATIAVPEAGPLAVGVGESAVDDTGRLSHAVRLRINGIEVTLAKL